MKRTLQKLKIKLDKLPKDKYNIPILNFSSESLKYGLHKSFVGKKKYVKRIGALEMESLD